MLDEIFATKTKDEWVSTFQEHDVWHTVVAKVDDICARPCCWVPHLLLLCLSVGLVAAGDSAQAQAVGAFAPLPYENAEVAEVIATPVKLVQAEGEPLSR